MPAPFRISVFDKAFAPLFPLGNPLSVSMTPRHLAKGTGSITIGLKHNRFAALMAPGVRATVDYLVDDQWQRLMSGPIWTRQLQGPFKGGVATFGIEDDYRILAQMLGWAKPSAALNAQTTAYDIRNGDGETVIKAYALAAATRLGLPLTMAPNLHRGGTINGNVRFENLGDVLPAMAAAAGLGITVTQVGTGLVLDVYVPVDRTDRVLSEASGTLLDWSYTSSGPTMTRAVVGGQGDLTARTFIQVTDAATEALWGTKVEGFVDASDTADVPTQTQRGQSAIDDGKPQDGFSVTLAENKVVKYGRNLHVGDLIAVQITDELATDDLLTECTVTWNKPDGLKVTPQIGKNPVDPYKSIVRVIATVKAGVAVLRSRK